VTSSFLRRRWPEIGLAVALVLAAAFTGLVWRSLAIILLGGTLVFSVRRRFRDVLIGEGLTVAILVVSIAVNATVDLDRLWGGAIKRLAEQAGSRYIERPLHIGRLGIKIALGRFVVEDLRIEGLKPADTPFFTARRITIDFPWWQVFDHNEFFIRSVEMSDWNMQIEKFEKGHSFPKFKHESKGPQGPKRFTTTAYYVHAYRGRFTYVDHGTWSTVASNLDIYVRHNTGKYLGTATVTNGSVRIKDYLPMRSDMRVKFQIDDGGLIRLPEIVLDTDGAHSLVHGQVDFGHWPEMIYYVDSQVDLWRMREIFFASESWRSRGEARFVGTFHLFDGGHELKGEFRSDTASVNVFAFPGLKGSLIWEPHRFEVTNATARFYGGTAKFRYQMAPLSDPKPAWARWDVTYNDVDLSQFSDAVGMRGLRLLGSASGHNLLEWPLGAFRDHQGNGHVTVAPPAGRTLLERAVSPWEAAVQAEPPEYGPERNVHRFPKPTAIGGEFAYTFSPGWLDVQPSHLATDRTYIEFQGRTKYGDDSEFPFYARSADWQESDRLMAGIITAFGSPTGIITVGGRGEFRGTMTKSFKDPLVQGSFIGEDMRAWDVVWGHATGRLSIENGYVDIARAVVTKEASSIDVEGRFSLGFPRKDGGEEINARFVLKDRPMHDLRHAFTLDDWPLEGKVSGEFRLYDKYTRPFGYGRLTIAQATAWGEPLERASAPMRFEGQGVRLDAVEIDKDGGKVTGAAYVGWDGRYSFNARGDRIPLGSLASIKNPAAAWSGLVHFSAAGASTFQSPHYTVQIGAEDVLLGEEGIGAVAIRLDVRDRLVTIDQLEAAGLGVSGSGQFEMSGAMDAELSLRFTKTLLDPYVRLFEPRLSPYARALASGSVRVVGQLANWDRLSASAAVDMLDVSLFDYDIRNEDSEGHRVPIRLNLDNNQLSVQQLKLWGRDTRLDVSGGISLKDRRIGVTVSGDADLGILPAFFKDMRSSGRAELRAAVNGTFQKPEFSGAAQISNGRIRLLSLPQSLQAINGRVAFGSDGIRLEDVTAQVAGGNVRFGGRVELNGFSIGQLALSASGENMEFRYPEGFRSTIDAQLDLVGTMAAPTLRGTVTVKNALYSKRVDIMPGLIELASGRGASGGGSSSAPSMPLRFDVRIQAPSSLRVESNLAHLVSSADLVLRGTYDHPLLFGRAEVERGEVLFDGKRYLVRHGTIDFTNPAKIEPYVDIEAETLIRVPSQTYVVNAHVVGTMKRIEPQLTSDPPLSELEIYSLLFGGDTARTEARDAELQTLKREDTQRELATTRMAQAAAGVITSPITKAVEQAFGLDTFQITPSVGYDVYQRLSTTARLTVGKRISNKVYLTFSRSLSGTGGADQVILLEYDESDRLSWIFSRNEDGTYALDVRVRHVF
jgi:hypothetical protein